MKKMWGGGRVKYNHQQHLLSEQIDLHSELWFACRRGCISTRDASGLGSPYSPSQSSFNQGKNKNETLSQEPINLVNAAHSILHMCI